MTLVHARALLYIEPALVVFRRLIYRPGCRLFEAGLRKPWVSAKFELRCERLKSKVSLILFAYNLIIGYSKNKKK